MENKYLYVVSGTDINERNTKVKELIASFGLAGPEFLSFAKQDLEQGRAKALAFFNSLESLYTLRNREERRLKNCVIIINCADEFSNIIPSHYRMLLFAIINTATQHNLGLRVVLAVNEDLGTPLETLKTLLVK